MPFWGWVVLVIIAIPALFVWLFVKRFRGMCRGVREDMGSFLKSRYPGAEVLREEMGNLVVRDPDGSEKLLEMADIYTEVARLPGMGADRQSRTAIYEAHTAVLFAPSADAALDAATHRTWIKPLLVGPGDAPAGAVGNLIPELGLTVIYPVGSPAGGRYVTEADLAALSVDQTTLHNLAVENLGRDFPRQMVESAVSGEANAIQFGDGFDASRLLLLPDLLTADQEVIALVPHRDMLLLMGRDSEPEKLREGLALLKCDHPPLLEQHLVRVTRSGFTLL